MPLFVLVHEIVWRRRRAIGVALAVPLAAAVALVLFLPRTYRSTALVVVEREGGVPDDDLDARVTALTSENLRRSRIYALIGRFGLYREMQGKVPREQLIDQFQKDARIELDKAERGGRNVVVSAHVSYVAADPQVAADVTNELADFFEREDLRMREQRARDSRNKLQEQLADAKRRLEEQEARLKDYKMRHLNELPEQVGLHLSALAQLNSQIRMSEPSRSAASQAGPHPKAGPQPVYDQRLDRLAELRSRFTDEHPDVKQLKREIAMSPVLPKEVPGGDGPAESDADVQARVDGVRRQVAELREQTAAHEQGILNAPFRQQELEAMLPDYIAARTRYQSLWEKLEVAQLWDPRHDAGAIVVLDAAVPRNQPVAPSVARILALGAALSLAAAALAAFLLEQLDTSFHTVADLRAFTRVPVLARVPSFSNAIEKRKQTKGMRRFTALFLVIVAFAFAGSAYVSRGNEALVTWMAGNRP